MPSNPALVALATDVVCRVASLPRTPENAARRLEWLVGDDGRHEPVISPRRVVRPVVGEVVWVDAFGRLRRGMVVKLTPTRCSVAYVVPSNTSELKVATVRHELAHVDRVRSRT